MVWGEEAAERFLVKGPPSASVKKSPVNADVREREHSGHKLTE
jgi:hypothetical protein